MSWAEETLNDKIDEIKELAKDMAKFNNTTVELELDRIFLKGEFGNKTSNLIKLGVKL